MYRFQRERFERAVVPVVVLARFVSDVGDGSPMAFSNAARTECRVEPA